MHLVLRCSGRPLSLIRLVVVLAAVPTVSTACARDSGRFDSLATFDQMTVAPGFMAIAGRPVRLNSTPPFGIDIPVFSSGFLLPPPGAAPCSAAPAQCVRLGTAVVSTGKAGAPGGSGRD